MANSNKRTLPRKSAMYDETSSAEDDHFSDDDLSDGDSDAEKERLIDTLTTENKDLRQSNSALDALAKETLVSARFRAAFDCNHQ